MSSAKDLIIEVDNLLRVLREWKNYADAQQEVLGTDEQAVSDSPESLEIQKRLNYLITKLNTTRSDRPCSPMLSGAYRDNIVKKIS